MSAYENLLQHCRVYADDLDVIEEVLEVVRQHIKAMPIVADSRTHQNGVEDERARIIAMLTPDG